MIERAVILAEDGVVSIPELGEPPRPPSPVAEQTRSVPELNRSASSPRSDGLDAVSRAHILHVLNETNWVVAGPHGAAARLEMKRSTLNFRMKKLGIVRPGRSPST